MCEFLIDLKYFIIISVLASTINTLLYAIHIYTKDPKILVVYFAASYKNLCSSTLIGGLRMRHNFGRYML